MNTKWKPANLIATMAALAMATGAAAQKPPTPLARQYEKLEAMHPIAIVQQNDFALDRDKQGEQLWPFVKCPIKPLLDVPLRDASICGGGDGSYYMVGTQGITPPNGTVDFQSSLTIKVWKSADGVQWQEFATAWDISDPRVYTPHPKKTPNRWMQFYRLDPDNPQRGSVRGITSPEIHYLKDTYWIAFAMNDQETGLLKSTTGKPEGPYENVALNRTAPGGESHARITTRGGAPSLFADDDGAVYFVWGPGWIARLKDDLSGLAERPRLLQCEPDSGFGDYPLLVGRTGAHLFKVNGQYCLTAMDINPRLNRNPCRDTFVAVADNIQGPYGPRQLLVPHGGQITTFRDAKGRLFAAMSGHSADPFARCPDRPAIAPLYLDGFLKRPALRRWTVTEAGLVSTLKPCWDITVNEPVQLRDPLVMRDDDGWYYVAGTTGKDKHNIPGARVWRSRDLKRWERIQRPGSDDGFIWSASQAEWSAKPQPAGKSALGYEHHDLWGPQLFKHNDTYWIPYMMFCRGTTSILKSTTGKPEGPYADTEFKWRDGAPHLFKDDDGSVWLHFCFGPPRIGKMKPDLSGFEIRPRDITYRDMARQGYEGTWIIKIGKKYVLFHTDFNGMDKAQRPSAQPFQLYSTYDWSYSTSDNILDGWSAPRPLVAHGGTASVFKDAHGNWWAALFGTDTTAPLPQSLSFVPLVIEERDGDVHIRIPDKFPEGYDMSKNHWEPLSDARPK